MEIWDCNAEDYIDVPEPTNRKEAAAFEPPSPEVLQCGQLIDYGETLTLIVLQVALFKEHLLEGTKIVDEDFGGANAQLEPDLGLDLQAKLDANVNLAGGSADSKACE